jgi:adenylate cyclase
VVFADIVGFTKITTGMKAYEVVSCLNKLFSEFDQLAAQQGVEKIKTIGDCYMAVSGVPLSRPDHATAAANLALDMISITERLQTAFPVPFQIRVSIHSGPAMAGVIGRRTFSYDVWGDTVNIAARLEAAAKPGGVLISAATAAELRDQFEYEACENVLMKDGRAIEAKVLLGRRSR